MHKKRESCIGSQEKILLTTTELQEILSCGRASAVKLGTAAHARVEIGRLVLWSREKVKMYVKDIADFL